MKRIVRQRILLLSYRIVFYCIVSAEPVGSLGFTPKLVRYDGPSDTNMSGKRFRMRCSNVTTTTVTKHQEMKQESTNTITGETMVQSGQLQ